MSFENLTSHRIQIDRFTFNFIGASGEIVGTYVGEPGSFLWVLEPGEKICLGHWQIPTSDEPINVQVDVDWHPTNEQFVNLTITEARVIHCSEYGEWDELLIRVRNDTNRVVHQATLLIYGEESPEWTGINILLMNIQPGEERQIGTTWCAGEVMWLLSSISSVKCIARLSDTSLP